MKFFKRITPRLLFIVFVFIWGVCKLCQAYFTELSSDEAYYAIYADYLAWGYFDHPPMVAWFIKLGSFLNGELGTRWMAVMAQLMVLVVLWKIIEEKEPTRKKVLVFFGLAASVVMFQVYGFVITPDVPLLLFTTLFLYVYKRFLDRESAINTCLLGITMAGMIYSKYHGVLVIGFVVLSNPRLLLNKRFYFSALFTLLLLIPHLYWQYTHHFSSFSYHLLDRSDGFKFFYLIEFWLNQLVVFNPAIFVLTLYLLFKFKPAELFERALFFIIGGFLLFFFIMSFKGHAEPHWTIVICLPMIILMYKYCFIESKLLRYAKRYIFPVIIIVAVLSFDLVFNVMKIPFGFNGNRDFAFHVESISQGCPVVFQNSYQKASVYRYYTDKEATTLNGFNYRQNQYDIWNFDMHYNGNPVVLLHSNLQHAEEKIILYGREQAVRYIESYQPFSKLRIDFELPKHSFVEGEEVTIPVIITNPYPFDIDFQHSELPLSICASYGKLKKRWNTPVILSSPLHVLKAGSTEIRNVSFVVQGNGERGCTLGLSFSAPCINPSFNSKFYKIKICSSEPCF